MGTGIIPLGRQRKVYQILMGELAMSVAITNNIVWKGYISQKSWKYKGNVNKKENVKGLY